MIPAEVRARVRESAEDRCGYCLSPQKYVLVPLELDHIMPLARGGTDDEENLWSEHFQWSGDGTQVWGRTATGRVTVEALNLNNPLAVAVRKAWVEVGWHPPDDSP